MRLAIFTRVTGALLAAAVAMLFLLAQANRPEDVGFIKPLPSPDPAAALIKAHGCWTGGEQAPVDMAGKFPTHAVVAGRYVGRHVTDLAFDQEIGGHPHGLRVQAFCR